MKRTGFKPKVYERAPRQPLRASAEFRYATAALLRAPEPKHEYVRSRLLLDSVRLLDRCNFCYRIAGVMACHSNWAIHGKGKGIKADDNRIAAGCDACHRELDQGKNYTEIEKQRAWWIAHRLTVDQMIKRGLWPDDVPIPDIQTNPWR